MKKTFLLLLIVTPLLFTNCNSGGSSNSLLKITLNPPQPRVVHKDAGKDESSTLFDFKAGVDATILNEGGSGNVLVTAMIIQDEESFEQSKEIYMEEDQTQDVHFTFPEVKLLSSTPQYKVTVKAIE